MALSSAWLSARDSFSFEKCSRLYKKKWIGKWSGRWSRYLLNIFSFLVFHLGRKIWFLSLRMSIRPLGVSGWNTKMFLLSSVNGFSSAFGSFPSFFWEKTFSPRFFHGPVIASWNRLKLASPPTSVHVLLTSGSPGGHLTCLLVCLELLLFFGCFRHPPSTQLLEKKLPKSAIRHTHLDVK